MSPPAPPPTTNAALLRGIGTLAWPTTLLSLLQVAVQLFEAWLAGRQGRAALAGWAVMLPAVMLLLQMSTGAMGGGVVSAVARALGAQRRDEAEALVLHALLIATGFGAAFALGFGLGARPLVAAVAGAEAAGHAAAYSAALFGAGALPAWWTNTLSAVLRGGGRHALVARVLALAALAQPLLAWALAEGAGLGLAGIGAAFAVGQAGAAAVLAVQVHRGAAGFAPRWRLAPSRALFARILAVGAVASSLTVMSNLTMLVVTAQLGRHGAVAVGGFGIAARLEYLVIPVAFGVGAALTALVGRAVGAGDWPRARRTAWLGGAVTLAITGTYGVAVGLAPAVFAHAFAPDAQVAAAAAAALARTGWAFGPLGLGFALYFASLGASRMVAPFTGTVARMTVAAGGAALWAASADGVYVAVALGSTAYGLVNMAGVRPSVWRARPA